MSFITSDTKGDLYRHYGKIAKEFYGYKVIQENLPSELLSNQKTPAEMRAYIFEPKNEK